MSTLPAEPAGRLSCVEASRSRQLASFMPPPHCLPR